VPPSLRAPVFVFALSLCGLPAAAREVIECRFPPLGNNMGYLPDMVMMARHDSGDTFAVADSHIQSVKGGPIDVKVAEENDAKISISWPLMLQSTTNSYVRMQYRISIQKRSLSASLTGRPQGFSNTFTAQGKCKRLEG
jgi:hypothetical protein